MYVLEKNAQTWREAMKKSKNVAIMTWLKFLREFNSKYYR